MMTGSRRVAARLLQGALLVFGIVTATFILFNIAPGDPARLWAGPAATAEQLQSVRVALGLDEPLPVRYLSWLADFVSGDWGVSIARQRPVTEVIADSLPLTVLLSACSLLITYVGAIIVGLWQSAREGTLIDRVVSTASLTIYGMPQYWLSLMAVLVFSYTAARYQWPIRFPAFGATSIDAAFLTPWQRVQDLLYHLALPLATLSVIGIAGTSRYVRARSIEIRNAVFLTSARARGVRNRIREARHVMRGSLVPVVTLLGLSIPALFSGTVFVEVIFGWPGVGREIVSSVAARDYPVIMASTAVFSTLVVTGNLIADVLVTLVDPRARSPR